MHSFIMKISHSLAAKDSIAVIRGIYKVIEGNVKTSKDQIKYSWHQNQKMKNNQEYLKQFKSNQNQTEKVNSHQNIYQNKNRKEILDIKNQHKQNIIKIKNDLQENKQKKQQSETTAKKQKEHYKQFINKISIKDQEIKKDFVNISQSKIPSSRLSRFFQFGKLGINIAESAVQAYFTNDNNPQKQKKTYQKIANKISDQLCKMRGAPLKLAQMLSIQEDKLIPAPIRKAFEKARQTAYILPKEQVEFMMKKNFGKDWNKLFIQFNYKPFASASIGQVHKATIQNFGQVAIKIQYPGVKKSISSDINNLNLLMKIPGVFPKGMYMQKILKKTKQQLTQECDYILQKQKQQVYQKCLIQSLKEQAKLFKVPKVNNKLTTEQVLISEYLSGIIIKKIQQNNYPQQIKDQIGRRIMKITFNQIFEMGIVQSDPNPANFTYNSKKDELNLFDFGAAHIYRKQFLEDYYKVIEGSVIQNPNQIFEASIKTGFLTGQQSQSMKQHHIQSINIVGQPLRYKGNYDFGSQKITQRIYKTIPYMLKNRLKSPPEQVYSLHRKLSGSYLACMRLKAKINCSKIWQDIKFQRIIEKVDKSDKSKLII